MHWFDGLLFVAALLIIFQVIRNNEHNKPRYDKDKAVKPMQFMPKGKISNIKYAYIYMNAKLNVCLIERSENV